VGSACNSDSFDVLAGTRGAALKKNIKKSFFFCIFGLLLVFPAQVKCEERAGRALFVSVIQDPPVLSSRNEISKLIEYARQAHISTLFVQVYRANKAWFPSKVADQTPYASCFKDVKEDPFALLIKQAHCAGIEVHAWINLLSLSTNSKAFIVNKFGKEILTKNREEKKRIEDYKIDDQYFLEPGDLRVRKELVDVVKEIILEYPELDGIQFDYIRYPDKHPFYGHTKTNIARFKKATGSKTDAEDSLLWKDWKRRQVTELLELLVDKTRQLRPNIQISTTGCVPYVRAYHEAFQDWPSWIKDGLVDFVTLMTYPTEIEEFAKYIQEAKTKIPDLKKAFIALGAYKLLRLPKEFRQELQYCENENSKGCAVLHYGSLIENPELGQALLIKNE
jgi:uncharacterized lipoprotein YddW (UPF0748 family)